MSTPLFPLFLKLAGRKVLLVGGGRMARVRLEGLLAARARVTLVAPEVLPELQQPGVTIYRRDFAPSDLEGAWLAVAAATPEVNRQVAAEAEALRIFVNAVDDPQSATAYTGGLVRRGGVTLAISTEGNAPALAGLLREGFEAVLPDEIESWVEQAHALRQEWRAKGVPLSLRRPLLLEALNRLYSEASAAEALQ